MHTVDAHTIVTRPELVRWGAEGRISTWPSGGEEGRAVPGRAMPEIATLELHIRASRPEYKSSSSSSS